MKKDFFFALVPMKGESQRVPYKNMQLINGKPLCFYILNTLTQNHYIDKIIVNTDGEKIKQYIQKTFPDIIVVDRPDYLLGHDVPMNDIIAYDINQFPSQNYFIQTHTTNPLLKNSTIDLAIQNFLKEKEKGYDSLFSVTEHYKRFYNSHFQAINHNPNELKQTQDLDPLLEENSSIYLFSQKSFSLEKRRIGEKPILFKIDSEESCDIDTMNDLQYVKFLLGDRA